MKPLLLSVAALVLTVPVVAPAGAPKRAETVAPAVQIDKVRIDRALAAMVSSGRAVGVSALIWKDGREVYSGTAGEADREAKRPMRRDALAQIYSMTKPVTGVALMTLWEQGKFGLDDPLARYLPEFAETKVFAGQDATIPFRGNRLRHHSQTRRCDGGCRG